MKKESFLTHASVFIGLILSGLYTTGLLHHTEYLRHLGIEQTQFQLPIERIFFQGFFFLADVMSKSVLHLIIAAISIYLFTLLGVALIDYLKKQDYTQKLSNFLNSRFAKQEDISSTPFQELAERMVPITYVIFLGYVLILIILVLSESTGRKHAKNFIEKIQNNQIEQHEILLKGETDPITGYPVICSDTQCAFYFYNKNRKAGESKIFNKRDIRYQQSKSTSSVK
jgi:hypothetical protein